ncbi:MAG TPA: FtsH protease activity modulator HflK [Steroidobacteraceae bacterium]|jgi:membrane protease subunit HflK|nr:FtsH protease activity modulator HflK [Steroidobacteraceae bacterium]
MAWNDPGGDKQRNPWNRPQQSQNDLDDVLRNLQRRLAALFGRSGSGTGGGAPGTGFARGLSSILILIGAVWIGSGVYRVDAQERAVVLRFGKYVDTRGPGYNWHLPWPIESKLIVNVSRQYSVVDDASMLTADTNLVEVKSAVQYIQPDALKLLFKVRDVEDTLTQVSESAMREAVGQAPLDKVLAYDPSITDRAKSLVQRTLDNYDMGIKILSVNFTGVNVPDAVQDAQRDAIKADKDRQRYQQDAETYRNDILPKARGAAAKAVLDAEAYKIKVVALAKGETARFEQVLAQYEHAPAVTRERMYLDTMEAVYKSSRKIINDTKGGSMMYLPLDKLMAPGAPGAAGPGDVQGLPQMRAPDGTSSSEDPARARGVR